MSRVVAQGHFKKIKYKSGYVTDHMLTHYIRIDVDTTNEIRELAIKTNNTFAEQIRLLIEWGLMHAEETEN